MRLLIVDDSRFHHRIMGQILGKIGMMNVDCVMDGQAALAVLTIYPYQLLFIDVEMPYLDGMELIRRIRQKRIGFQPYIVLATAKPHRYAEEARLVGINDQIAKPCDNDEIVAVLKRATAYYLK
ncbi:MAG TPA: response regulator [Anaerolineae bacterium]|nr:response regulator [Anaerolineae bacterium]